MYQFELLAGRHVDENGTKYQRGDRITSTVELDKRFGSNKFRRVADLPKTAAAKAVAVEDEGPEEEDDWGEEIDLESMSLKALRQFARQEDISLEGASRKDDVVARIREQL